MDNEQVSQEQQDEIKKAVGVILQKIESGEAPAEMVAVYQSMKPENFGFWLHGFVCAYNKKLHSFEAFRFLSEELKNASN